VLKGKNSRWENGYEELEVKRDEGKTDGWPGIEVCWSSGHEWVLVS